jgi:hypothetical protein
MWLDTEAHLALYRFVRELESAPPVKSVHGLMMGAEMHVWIVLRERSRDARYAVYTAQLKADPEFLLMLHFTESLDAVPKDAARVDRVRI